MERPVLAAWAAVALLSVGGVVGAVSVDSTPGAASVSVPGLDPLVDAASTTASAPTPTDGPTTTRAPVPTPAGWTLVRGDGWKISMPAKPELRTAPATPSAAYKALSTYSIEGSPDDGTSLFVFHYGEKPPPGSTATAMIAVVNVAEGTMGPIGSADIGGRFGQTSAVSLKGGPGLVTGFVSGNDLFVLGTRNTSVHSRILATFGS